MRGLLVVLMCAGVSGAARAQEDFSRLALTPGQTIFVTDTRTGTEVSGVVTQVSATELTVGGRRFTPSVDLKIARTGDALWNGAAIGFAIGAVSGLTIGAEACADSAKWHCVGGGGLTLGALGALIDWAHSGRTTIYDGRTGGTKQTAWAVTPLVTAHSRSVALTRLFR